MSITIISVGKKSSNWLQAGIDEYAQRMRKPFDVEWQLLPHATRQDRTIEDESKRILSRCRENDFVILLDERGEQLTSPQLSRRMQAVFNRGLRVVLIVGGAFGVDSRVINRADLIWSLSVLVLPHQIVRLVLAEQLYRAQTIALGQKYHHE